MFFQKVIFWIQAFWFRLIFFGCFLLLAGVFVYGASTHTLVPKNWEEEEVPFIEEAQKNLTAADKTLPLDQPNRSYIEMEEWVSVAVTEAMSLQSKNLREKLQTLEKDYFAVAAFNDYKQSLADTNISGVVQNQGMKTSVYLEGAPVLLNEGVTEGRYSWLYDVPLAITYVPENQTEYRPGQNIENVPVTVRVQIGRIQDPEDSFAVRIDTWQLTGRRVRKSR